ncbi:DNA topoisomerase I [Candidatus Woesearchaeota archaeon CG1_02_57_44]|nr:MAG: DNA topoisomerase I [Candidatus Woesearchaeota archaeon CG1_02_57_44]
MTELIISEKPQSAQKIAAALADSKPIQKKDGKVSYWLITHKDKDIVVASTVGHIFGLDETKKGKWTYPVWDISWKPNHLVEKGSAYSKKYLDVIKKLAKDAKSFTVATDYDVEGSVIGYNVIRYACGKKDAKRMKFSTLTKNELIDAYEQASPHLDLDQAIAGETRHYLDYYYGINLSRALTHAVKAAGAWHVLSSGRVQGPALKIIVEREREISAFIPEPYWEITATAEKEKMQFIATHEIGKCFDKKKAEDIFSKVKGATKGTVSSVERKEFSQAPPVPFDLTTLQTEAYRHFRIKPKDTLAIAQDLYTAGTISYPRTSSQQLPPQIGYARIMNELSGQEAYEKLCAELLRQSKGADAGAGAKAAGAKAGTGGKPGDTLSPNNGKKTDPAHPAIYPTGEHPGGLKERPAKVYDLIVRRFLATFAPAAVRATMTIVLAINEEPFKASGTTTVSPGWHTYYGPYAKYKEEELPVLTEKESVALLDVTKHDKQTEPPKRYTPASIVRELEKRNLGTKATRASIVDTLFSRNYVFGDSIQATELGMATVAALEKHCPRILDEELTKTFEGRMEDIREHKTTQDEVLSHAKEVLGKILEEFKKKEATIGADLKDATRATRDEMNTVGPCPNCGANLRIIVMKARGTRFVGCGGYPDCRTTYPLPRMGLIKPTGKPCKTCSSPIVTVIRKGKRPWSLCLNPMCPEKEAWQNKNETKKEE